MRTVLGVLLVRAEKAGWPLESGTGTLDSLLRLRHENHPSTAQFPMADPNMCHLVLLICLKEQAKGHCL